MYVPVVTLKTEDNSKLYELLDSESDVSAITSKSKDNKFKRTVYRNEYKSKIETITQAHNNNNLKRTLLDVPIPGVNKLFVMGFNDNDALQAGNENNGKNTLANKVERDSYQQYFLPRVDIKDYKILIDGKNFYDQNISDDFKKYEEMKNVMTGRGENFTTESLLDYDYWKNNYKLICCDLSKQKVLGSNPKANQQIEYIYKLDNSRIAPGTKAQNFNCIRKRKGDKLRI